LGDAPATLESGALVAATGRAQQREIDTSIINLAWGGSLQWPSPAVWPTKAGFVGSEAPPARSCLPISCPCPAAPSSQEVPVLLVAGAAQFTARSRGQGHHVWASGGPWGSLAGVQRAPERRCLAGYGQQQGKGVLGACRAAYLRPGTRSQRAAAPICASPEAGGFANSARGGRGPRRGGQSFWEPLKKSQ
jgi:hypothetical protein